MDNEKRYTIYAHVNKSNYKIYIGVTGQSATERWCKGKGYRGCTAFERAIRKYGWDGFFHIILKNNLTMEEASQLECDLIKEYSTTDPRYGYNCRTGGYTGYSVSEETKMKLRNANLGKKYLSEETKYKRSIAVRSREVIFNNLARQNAKIARSVQIDQYDIDKNFVRRWDSISDAAQHIGCSHQNISRCLVGKAHTCFGSYWSYAGQSIIEPTTSSECIVQLEPKTGKIVATYKSIQEATNITGIPKSNICRVCNGQRNKAGGFRWSREIIEHKGETS